MHKRNISKNYKITLFEYRWVPQDRQKYRQTDRVPYRGALILKVRVFREGAIADAHMRRTLSREGLKLLTDVRLGKHA